MNAKLPNTAKAWIDPEDAPEITEDFGDRAIWTIGGEQVTQGAGRTAMRQGVARGRPHAVAPKVATTIRFDADLLAVLKASGRGWQTRVNALLREAVDQGRVKP